MTFKFLAVSEYLSYFIEPLFGIGLSFLLLRGGFLKTSFLLWSLSNDIGESLYRGVSYFVLPFLGQGQVYDGYSLTGLCIIIFQFLHFSSLLKWLDYDFTSLRREILDKVFKSP